MSRRRAEIWRDEKNTELNVFKGILLISSTSTSDLRKLVFLESCRTTAAYYTANRNMKLDRSIQALD